MNTITPLMRAVLDALDHDEEGFCHGDVACLVHSKLPDVEADAFEGALFDLAANGLIEHVVVQSPSGALFGNIFKLTEPGRNTLWVLQKADAMTPARTATDWTGH